MSRTLRPVLGAWLASAGLLACASEPPTSSRTISSSSANHVISVLTSSVVMSGLNSPRGLAFAPNGALYVAEAGTLAQNGPCTTVVEGGANVTKCYSGTGSISRLWKGQQQRTATGLPSAYTVQ